MGDCLQLVSLLTISVCPLECHVDSRQTSLKLPLPYMSIPLGLTFSALSTFSKSHTQKYLKQCTLEKDLMHHPEAHVNTDQMPHLNFDSLRNNLYCSA